MPARRVKRATVSRGDDAVAVQNAAVQEHAGEAREVAGRAEEARVGGDATHGEGVLVVHLALEEASAPGVEFGGSDPWAQATPAGGTSWSPSQAA